jgi:hypothetical protein
LLRSGSGSGSGKRNADTRGDQSGLQFHHGCLRN